MRTVTVIKRTISLPRRYDRVLQELAKTQFDGNLSATVRTLLDSHPVTKSALELSPVATRRSR